MLQNHDNQNLNYTYIVRFGYTKYRTKTYFSCLSLHINPNYDVLHCNLHNFRYFEDCNHVVYNFPIHHKKLHIQKPSNPVSCYISFCIPQHLYLYTRLSCDLLHILFQCTDNFPLQLYKSIVNYFSCINHYKAVIIYILIDIMCLYYLL